MSRVVSTYLIAADERATDADCGEPHRLDLHASMSLVTDVVAALCTVEAA